MTRPAGELVNRFALVSLVRVRATEIIQGSPPRVYVPSGKPVSIAMDEVAAGETRIKRRRDTQPAIGRQGDDAVIVCRDCGVLARIRRKPGVVPQGRPPTRCADHGLSPNWEQVTTLATT